MRRDYREEDLLSFLAGESEDWPGAAELEALEPEAGRCTDGYVCWFQRALNRILGLRLAEDGVMGPMTRTAVRSFQQKNGLTADGCVGPATERLLVARGAGSPPARRTLYPAVNVQLPRSGPGFYCYASPARQYGLAATISALQSAGSAWQSMHPEWPRIGIGDLSLQGGGYMCPHESHQRGAEVDLRPVQTDGGEAPVDIGQCAYDRARTLALVDHIISNGVLPVHRIYFSDPCIHKARSVVRPLAGHSNHLHVRFAVPQPTSQEVSRISDAYEWDGRYDGFNTARPSRSFVRRCRFPGRCDPYDPARLTPAIAA